MAPCSFLLFLFFCLFFISSLSCPKTPSRPVLQVIKDAKTLQYITQISQGTPLVTVNLTLDLGGPSMWVNCEHGHPSSTYTPARCGSSPCRLLYTINCDPKRAFCPLTVNTCGHSPFNPITNMGTCGQLGGDIFKVQSANGMVLTVPRLYYVCGIDFINVGLATGVTGMAGLGRTNASLLSQLSSYFRFEQKFALCLSSSSGAVFFGDGPYTMLPNIDDALSALTYTPLIVNMFTDEWYKSSPNYYIGVKSIKVDNKHVNGFNTSLLSFDAEGNGGTTISTAFPYTTMESSIYKVVVSAFVKAMPKKVKRVANIEPFGACFSSKNIPRTRLGPSVPLIELELESKNVWRINGANSMVKVKKNVLCLAFVEREPYRSYLAPMASVVIGGHQIENNLLQFDLTASRLGFSSSLLQRSITCANVNFTSTF